MLFSSLAFAFRDRLLGVVLTGHGEDGAIGVELIKSMGGQVIAQDALSSAAFDMPAAAIRSGGLRLILPLDKIAPALIALTMTSGAAGLFFGASSGASD